MSRARSATSSSASCSVSTPAMHAAAYSPSEWPSAMSPVTPFYDREAGTLRVSMTEGRAKTANLRRDPRAALEVTSADGWSWATAEGSVTLTGPATDPDGPEVQALVDSYRDAAGEHPDWAEYRTAVARPGRGSSTATVAPCSSCCPRRRRSAAAAPAPR